MSSRSTRARMGITIYQDQKTIKDFALQIKHELEYVYKLQARVQDGWNLGFLILILIKSVTRSINIDGQETVNEPI